MCDLLGLQLASQCLQLPLFLTQTPPHRLQGDIRVSLGGLERLLSFGLRRRDGVVEAFLPLFRFPQPMLAVLLDPSEPLPVRLLRLLSRILRVEPAIPLLIPLGLASERSLAGTETVGQRERESWEGRDSFRQSQVSP